MGTPIKSYSKTELAHLYDVSMKTLKKWLHPFREDIGEYTGRRYTPQQVATIFDKLGTP